MLTEEATYELQCYKIKRCSIRLTKSRHDSLSKSVKYTFLIIRVLTANGRKRGMARKRAHLPYIDLTPY